jgi:hypothetical protein
MNQNSSPAQPEKGSKLCSLCHHPRNVLIRCQIDATQKWHFVCTGKCWNEVSGGKVDGPGFPNYKYGGMWKNKHAGASAKIKGKAKVLNREGERMDRAKVKGNGRRKEGRLEIGGEEIEDEVFGSCEDGGGMVVP